MELVHGRVDVPRDGDVDEEEGLAAARRERHRLDHDARRTGGGQNDVDLAESTPRVLEGERRAAKTSRERVGGVAGLRLAT